MKTLIRGTSLLMETRGRKQSKNPAIHTVKARVTKKELKYIQMLARRDWDGNVSAFVRYQILNAPIKIKRPA